jgi:RNA-directed DNA polymerase
VISAPSASLDSFQRRILATLGPLTAPVEASHGFVKGRSILTNARPHIGRLVVARIDLAAFFHSIGSKRVEGIMASLGVARKQAKLWSIVCTQSIQGRGRVLPQGACTSPLLSNLASIGLDASISALCSEKGYSYTRYADDITISGNDALSWPELMGRIVSAVERHGFTVNHNKTKVMFAHCKQSTAGVVVNSTANVARDTRKRNRAAMHNATMNGLSPTAEAAGMASHIKHIRGK